jgi:protein-tyrosine phosphatase
LLATGWPLERYLYDPAADDGAPKPPEWFEHAIRFALPVLAVPGNSILVHCGAGANRGPSLAYAILRALGWTRDGAFNLIREKRPQAGIAYREHAEQALSALGWVRM